LLLGNACAGADRPSVNADASDPPPDERALELADVETACSRGDASSWTQIFFYSKKWRELAQRADARDPEAWREIADAFKAHNRSVGKNPCSAQRIAEIRATASRLAK
jgi:hypothetical protein